MKSRFCSTASAVPRYHSRARPRPMNGCSRVTPPRLRSRSQGRPTPMWSISERGAYWVRTADVGQAGVHRVGQREVDDPVLATERDARLRAHLRQDREPLALAARQDQGQDRCGHASDSPMRRAMRGLVAVAASPATPGPDGPARAGERRAVRRTGCRSRRRAARPCRDLAARRGRRRRAGRAGCRDRGPRRPGRTARRFGVFSGLGVARSAPADG